MKSSTTVTGTITVPTTSTRGAHLDIRRADGVTIDHLGGANPGEMKALGVGVLQLGDKVTLEAGDASVSLTGEITSAATSFVRKDPVIGPNVDSDPVDAAGAPTTWTASMAAQHDALIFLAGA